MSAQLEIRQYSGGGRHAHDFVQVLFPMRGAMQLDIEGVRDVVSSHRVAVIREGHEHDYVPSPDCRLMVLDVESGEIGGDLPSALVTPVDPFLWRLFSLLGQEVSTNTRRAADAASLALTGLRLVRSSPAPESETDTRIEAALALSDGGVADMARHAGLGRSQFHALFRATTGRSPKQHRLVRLLDRAVDRLTGGREPVSVIAYDLGYQNVSSFNRLFKQRFGVTPSEFRRNG
ncbi:MAG: helix-turn-helix domain-containing protein [Pseudomonadota bacterium]